MKSLPRLALAVCLAPLCASATTAPHPLTADVYRELLRFRTQAGTDYTVPFSEAALGTPQVLQLLLDQPSSPYSNLSDRPDFTNELWWEAFAHELDASSGLTSALETLQWQLGLTKARPGQDVEITETAIAEYRGREAAANALKAGIHPRIYAQAWDMNPSHITIAAQDAVGLQLLYEQIKNTPKEKWDAFAIRPQVLKRYMRSSSPDDISEADTRYLAALVTQAIRAGSMSQGKDGTQQLPAAFRIARTAAAYKDARGYFSGRPYCINDAPRMDLPTDSHSLDDHAPLCFVAATDRGVLAWYREEARLELSGVRIHETHGSAWNKVLYLFGVVLPVLDLAALIEFTEVAVADELAESSAIDANEAEAASARTGQLTCGIRNA